MTCITTEKHSLMLSRILNERAILYKEGWLMKDNIREEIDLAIKQMQFNNSNYMKLVKVNGKLSVRT